MNNFPFAAALSLTFALGLAACSRETKTESNGSAQITNSADVGAPPSDQPSSAAMSSPISPSPAEQQAKKNIALEGLGDLRLGQPVPKNGIWAERGAQTGDGCRTVSASDYPGVYGMVVDGKVRRITVGQRSDVKLVEGIGVGATEGDVKKWFAGFRAEPHKYEPAPAKYLTAPNAASGDPALRFEIGGNGKVKMIHVGMMPQLAYVEGCG